MTTNQSTSAVFMVHPTTFGFDEETALSNTFQHHLALAKDEVRRRVGKEFEAAVNKLRNYGIVVTVFQDTPTPEKPDAVFPNNWVSTWPNGDIYLYPMATASRRIERSRAAINLLEKEYAVNEIVSLIENEENNLYLESTGVIIFDHNAKIAYGCLSLRCNEALFREHTLSLGYKPMLFKAFDQNNIPIYHTNVIMGVQSSTAIVCLEAIHDPTERQSLVTSLEQTGHTVVAISQQQMNSFCGNILELRGANDKLYLAMSQTAYNAFTPEQREVLSRDKTLLPLSIPTIETIGGGSVRCMLAEVFLPKKISQ